MVWSSEADTMRRSLGEKARAFFSLDGGISYHALVMASSFVWDCNTGERVPSAFESDMDAKLSFTGSGIVPYIMTPPQSNVPLQTPTSSYSFQLDNGAGVACGVATSGVNMLTPA
jgi:hypothetical protein